LGTPRSAPTCPSFCTLLTPRCFFYVSALFSPEKPRVRVLSRPPVSQIFSRVPRPSCSAPPPRQIGEFQGLLIPPQCTLSGLFFLPLSGTFLFCSSDQISQTLFFSLNSFAVFSFSLPTPKLPSFPAVPYLDLPIAAYNFSPTFFSVAFFSMPLSPFSSFRLKTPSPVFSLCSFRSRPQQITKVPVFLN